MRKKHVVANELPSYGMVMSKQLNISREAAGWSVRIVRDGTQHSKYFRFSEGGVRAALARAKQWRDAKLRELGKRTWRSGPRKKAVNNTSGTVGVSKKCLRPLGRHVAGKRSSTLQDFPNKKRGDRTPQTTTGVKSTSEDSPQRFPPPLSQCTGGFATYLSAFHFGVASIRQFLPFNSIPGTRQLSATSTNSYFSLSRYAIR